MRVRIPRVYRVTWTDRDGKMGSVELFDRVGTLQLVEALHDVGCVNIYVIDLRTGEVL